MVTNSIAQKKPKFSVAIQSDAYKNLINSTLRDPKRANNFVASVMSAVATNPALQECEAGTILSAALLGESLNLCPSPQLGQFYMVPYKDNKRGISNAQFQLGYKGYIQLAVRSGQYKRLNVVSLKDGELVSWNPLTEEIEVNIIDSADREDKPTTGYVAMFEYINGFRKTIYWSRDKMLHHADTYSKAFSLQKYEQLQRGEIPQQDLWKYSSFWYKSFDDMACKTMLRQLISRWGIMSTELQTAYERDMAVIKTDGNVDYVDNPDTTDEPYEAPAQPSEPTQQMSDDTHAAPADASVNEFFNN